MSNSTSPDNLNRKPTVANQQRGDTCVALRLDAEGGIPVLTQLIPAGYFRARDGRPATSHPSLLHWFLDAPAAQSLISRFIMEAMPLLVDYEHQTMAAEINGQPAPAAGWGKNLQFAEDGLYAEVEWTTRAKEMIKAGEYKYLSPVFTYDAESGQVLKLLHVALTNYPALTDLKPVTAKTQKIESTQEAPMALKPETLAALGLPATADDEAVHTAVTALKNVVANPATPDPSKFVPIAQVEAIKTELVQLKASQAQSEMDAFIKQGKDDGKLLPAQEAWARTLNVVQLKAYLEQTPAIAALKGNQTGGKAPAEGTQDLTSEQKEACRIMGWDESVFKGGVSNG